MKILFAVCTKQNVDDFFKSRIYRSLSRYYPMTCNGCREHVTDEGYTELFIQQPLKDKKSYIKKLSNVLFNGKSATK